METSVRRCGLMSSIAVVEETRSVEVFSLDVVHLWGNDDSSSLNVTFESE